MVDASIIAAVVFAGAVLGAFGRSMFPYLRKLKEQEDIEAEGGQGTQVKFQRKYTYSAIFAAITSIIVGMTLFPQLFESIPDEAPVTGIFITSFLLSWGTGDLVNQVMATGKSTAAGVEEKQPAIEPKPQEPTQ